MRSGKRVNEEGEFSTYFNVPDKLTDGEDDEVVRGGTYWVYVTEEDDEEILAVAEFTVIAAEIELDPDEGIAGIEVEITGAGFNDNEGITVVYDGDELDVYDGDDETDGDGEFESTIIIPESTAGEHTIEVEDDNGGIAEAVFTVEPEISISPEEARALSSVAVTGTGFDSGSDITIQLDGDEVATDQTDSSGSFEVTIEVPEVTPGTYDIEVEDEENNSAAAELEVIITISVEMSPTDGAIGDDIVIIGNGYLPGAKITIEWDNTQVDTVTADNDGSFTRTFKVPEGKSGAHDVSVSDGTTETFIFTIESEPPPIPKPLLPELGVKANQPVQFDWDNVTDASQPVTYTLQIATSESFSAGSIVLEKAGLTSSEYTLTTQLEPATKDSPYFWRVIATDAADNESHPTGTGSFYTGGAGFGGIPSWLTYLMIALGVLLLGFLAFWLGRRTASM
jgi:hypothetical protein